MTPRHLVIRTLTPLVWRLWPRRQQEALLEFSQIEKDSGLQLLHCMRLTEEPQLQGYLFQHVLEELFHGELFYELSRKQADKIPVERLLEREELVSPEDGPDAIVDFFAYVHVGERAVNRDFVHYSRADLEPGVRGVFRVAGMDEGRHEADTDDILTRLLDGDRAEARRRDRWATLKHAWKSYADTMQRVGVIPLTLLLGGVYFLASWIAVPSLRKRLALDRGQQLDIFREQVEEFRNT